MRYRTLLIVVAPIVAVATLMIGLRVGAEDAVRAAVVFGAPPPRPLEGGKTTLAWQVLTLLHDRGVRETIPIAGLTVVARARGQEARWEGESNEDGIAEPRLVFDKLEVGDPVALEVWAEGDPAPLAKGEASWAVPAGPTSGERESAVRPSKRKGAVALDVAVEGERLVTGFPSPVWVRATAPGVRPGDIEVELSPEPGLLVSPERVRPCAATGWAEIAATAQTHVVGLGLRARAGSAEGEWFGAVPVAPGAFYVSMPRVIAEATPLDIVLVAPNPRTVVYAEVDDTRGRAFAAALAVVTEPGDPTPRAHVTLPPLARGLHWLVVSGEPRAAEHLGGAAIARPFLVGGAPEGAVIDVNEPCEVGPWLARRAPLGTGRWVALDGLPGRSRENRTKRRLGLFIALLSLGAAGLLEVLLLSAAAREARLNLDLAALEDEGAPRAPVTARPAGGSIVVALLLAVLGFALLAALVIAKG
jgi:hypothetical protein